MTNHTMLTAKNNKRLPRYIYQMRNNLNHMDLHQKDNIYQKRMKYQ